MLVVLDANVFVSAAIQRGASHRIVQAWLGGTASFDVVMCPTLLTEIREVLTARPRLRTWISLETRDPADDYPIALARTNDVELIVSGDKDLLEWKTQPPPVMTPSGFEQRFGTD